MKNLIRKYRGLALTVVAWGLFSTSTGSAKAQNTSVLSQTYEHAKHDGEVVSVTGDKLVMTGADAQQHSYLVPKNAKLTLDGNHCQLIDLPMGARIRITTSADDQAVIRIEGLKANSTFANNVLVGKLVSLIKNELVMSDELGKGRTLRVSVNTPLTIDGKACQPYHLKKELLIRVFTEEPMSDVVTRIEGIERDSKFSSDWCEGKLTGIIDGKLSYTCLDNRTHTASLIPTTKLTLDGKSCKLETLKSGTRVRVSLQDAFSTDATQIEAIEQNSDFVTHLNDGTVISISADDLVIRMSDGVVEHSFKLSPDLKATLDGKVIETSNLKAGMRIRVTSANKDALIATRIEALDKQRAFTTRL